MAVLDRFYCIAITIVFTKAIYFFPDMGEIKQSYNIQPAHNISVTNGYRGNHSDEPISRDLKAAQVHGQIMNDEGITRKPTRLEALPSVGKKSKKKRNTYEGI